MLSPIYIFKWLSQVLQDVNMSLRRCVIFLTLKMTVLEMI